MSKDAANRAMREARYQRRSAGTSAAATPAKAAVRPPKAEPAEAAEAIAPPDASEALCGHRSMNGRTCTREHGHAAKSHRYS